MYEPDLVDMYNIFSMKILAAHLEAQAMNEK